MQIDAKIHEGEPPKETGTVPFKKIIFTQANHSEKMYIYIGIISAAVCGLGLPSFVFLFGNIANSFYEAPIETLNEIESTSLILTFVGAGAWVLSYIFFTSLIISSERIGQKTRTSYLRSVLQ